MTITPSMDTICMNCFAQLASPGGPCPECGYSESAQTLSPHHLPPRTLLNAKYLVGRVLGEGGFGITYIAWHLNLNIKVAIKEYYPVGFVTRETTVSYAVQPFTGASGDYFIKGRTRFTDEARNLAKFHALPGIVRVNDFFSENGTAYIVMEFIEGQTLKSYLTQMGGKLPARQVFDMMKPVMTALAAVHKDGMIHRDISPDNLMIDSAGDVKLLDFGAAKAFAESGNKSLSVVLKPGFAPLEQYQSRGKQGPWTDIYALCATLYRAISGVTPDESVARVIDDTLQPPHRIGVVLPHQQETALIKGLAVHQRDRFQSISELYDALYTEDTREPEMVPVTKPLDATIQPAKKAVKKNPAVIIGVCAVILMVMTMVTFVAHRLSAWRPQYTETDITEYLDITAANILKLTAGINEYSAHTPDDQDGYYALIPYLNDLCVEIDNMLYLLIEIPHTDNMQLGHLGAFIYKKRKAANEAQILAMEEFYKLYNQYSDMRMKISTDYLAGDRESVASDLDTLAHLTKSLIETLENGFPYWQSADFSKLAALEAEQNT